MTRKEKMERGWSIQPPDQANIIFEKRQNLPIITDFSNWDIF